MISPFDLNLRHLEAAAAVAGMGGISAAALAVNLSQPALTQGLGKLEARIGRRLFDRHAGGASATPAGAILAGRVERAVALLDDASRQARRVKRLPALGPVARHLTMTQLRAVTAVDRMGGYAAAAAATGVSQPALHNAVRDLEMMLGVALLSREGRMVRATPAARRFLRPARLAISELQSALDEIEALSAGGAGRVVVGAMPLARAALLPATLARFARAFPLARVRVVEGPYAELLAGLCNGEIDCLIGALRDPLLAPKVVQHPLFDDRLHVVCRTGHPLSGGGATIDQLAAHRWVMASPGAPLHARWRAMFETAGVAPPPVAVECGSVIAIRGLLLADDWLTVLSPDQFRIEERAGLLTRVGGPISGSERSIGLTLRQDWQPTRLQQAFLDELKAQVAKTKHPQTQ
ncbi:LysR substrate-binding domain-containing protein [Phenylobacterium sp.]|uniref:LysR substrate-binding domain-containing protein n=1 Tax=Phenylobacterium sp. TaxID=1871053 RepID=UPI002FE1A585